MTDWLVVSNLKRSMGVVGQLAPVLYCLQHPDRVLSGTHRIEAGATETQQIDCDYISEQNHISHEAAETLVAIEANTQRQVGREEKAATLLTLCRQLAEDNPEEKVASIVVGLVKEDMPRSTVYPLILDRYKEHTGRPKGVSGFGNSGQSATPVPPTEAEMREIEIYRRHNLERRGKTWTNLSNGDTGISQLSIESHPYYRAARKEIAGRSSSVAPLVKEVEQATADPSPTPEETEAKRQPYSKGTSPSLNQNNPAQMTETHLRLFGIVKDIPGTNFLNEKEWAREGEFTREGVVKSYQTDLADFGLHLVLEAQGTVHDDELEDVTARDAFFKTKGMEMLKFDNRDIAHVPHLVKQVVELKVENIGLRKRLAEKELTA